MRHFSLVWKNLTRRRMRSVLTIVGLAVAVAAVVSLVGISDGFSRQYKALYARRGIDLVVQRVGSGAELNNGLPEALGAKIEKAPGVSVAMGGLMDILSFPDKDLMNVIVNGWPIDSPLFKELKLEPGGRLPTAADRKKVLLGNVLAANLGVKLGDKIPIYGDQVQVIGIYDSSQVYESGAMAIPLRDLQQFMNRPHQVTGYIIRSNIPKDGTPEHQAALSALSKQIEALEPGIAAVATNDFIENVGPIRLSNAVAWATSAIALLIGAIGMLNTMVMSVYERIKEIGTLRAIGWRKYRVMRLILVESLLLSLAGGIVGSIAAICLTHVLAHMRFTSGYIQGEVAPWVVAEGCLLAVAIGLAGAIYPAYWGANLRPIEALRRSK
jgi:putative ABC transport system permease protein